MTARVSRPRHARVKERCRLYRRPRRMRPHKASAPATFAMSTIDAAPLAPAFSFFGQGSSEGELCPLLTTSPAFS
jgi:hypothetical protein